MNHPLRCARFVLMLLVLTPWLCPPASEAQSRPPRVEIPGFASLNLEADTSAARVLSALFLMYGLPPSPVDVNAALGTEWNPGMDINALADQCTSWGYVYALGSKVRPVQVKDYLAQKIPLIVPLQGPLPSDTTARWCLIIGYDDYLDTISIYDGRDATLTTISWKDFLPRWQALEQAVLAVVSPNTRQSVSLSHLPPLSP